MSLRTGRVAPRAAYLGVLSNLTSFDATYDCNICGEYLCTRIRLESSIASVRSEVTRRSAVGALVYVGLSLVRLCYTTVAFRHNPSCKACVGY